MIFMPPLHCSIFIVQRGIIIMFIDGAAELGERVMVFDNLEQRIVAETP